MPFWVVCTRLARTFVQSARFCASDLTTQDPIAGTITGATGLEPATSGVTGRRSDQLNYAPQGRGILAETEETARSRRTLIA